MSSLIRIYIFLCDQIFTHVWCPINSRKKDLIKFLVSNFFKDLINKSSHSREVLVFIKSILFKKNAFETDEFKELNQK